MILYEDGTESNSASYFSPVYRKVLSGGMGDKLQRIITIQLLCGLNCSRVWSVILREEQIKLLLINPKAISEKLSESKEH